jgi:hypothetical protein
MHSPPIYRVYLTRNSEYHLENNVCVAVRDRRTGRWFDEHPALTRPLATAQLSANNFTSLHTPNLGESLDFAQDGELLRTSPVLNIEERDMAGGKAASVSRSSTRPTAHRTAKTPPAKTGQLPPVLWPVTS